MPKREDDFKTTIMKGLELKKQELLKTLDSLMKARREYEGQLTAGDFIEEADGVQSEISAYSEFNLIERKNKELKRIDYLLSRAAEEQDFGLCEQCGARIPKKRLLLVPEATLCLACQRELERSDSRTSMAPQSNEFIPTRREESLETTEAPSGPVRGRPVPRDLGNKDREERDLLLDADRGYPLLPGFPSPAFPVVSS